MERRTSATDWNITPICLHYAILWSASWSCLSLAQVTNYLAGKPAPKKPKKGRQAAPKQAKAGRVIVVGAGPAGLAAALHMQVTERFCSTYWGL